MAFSREYTWANNASELTLLSPEASADCASPPGSVMDDMADVP